MNNKICISLTIAGYLVLILNLITNGFNSQSIWLTLNILCIVLYFFSIVISLRNMKKQKTRTVMNIIVAFIPLVLVASWVYLINSGV